MLLRRTAALVEQHVGKKSHQREQEVREKTHAFLPLTSFS